MNLSFSLAQASLGYAANACTLLQTIIIALSSIVDAYDFHLKERPKYCWCGHCTLGGQYNLC